MLWADRAGLWIESGGNDNARARAGRRELDHQWREDVDHERIHGACRDHLGQDRRWRRGWTFDSRIRGADIDVRIQREEPEGQAFVARVGHLRAVLAGRTRA